MKIALIENGIVVNVIAVSAENRSGFGGEDIPDGVPVDIGWGFANGVFTAPAPTLAESKTAKNAEINAACEAAIVGGFASSALGSPHTYDSELEDQLNLIGAVGLGTDLPYRCADAVGVKEFRLHTAAQLKQVAADGAAIKLAALEKAATLKAQVQAAADAAAVGAVVW